MTDDMPLPSLDSTASTVATPGAPEPLLDKLSEEPARLEAIVSLSLGLIHQAGMIWDATYVLANDNPAKAALRPIAEELLLAGLALLQEGTDAP